MFGPGESWRYSDTRVGGSAMADILHGSARTTPRVRSELQASMAFSLRLNARNFKLAHCSWVAISSFGVFLLGTRSSPLRLMPTRALLRLADLIGFLGNSTTEDSATGGNIGLSM